MLCLAAHRHRAADTNHKMHLRAQPTENSCLVQEFMSITPIATGHVFGHVREAWLAQARIQHDYSPSDSSTCAHMTTHHQMCQIYRHEHFLQQQSQDAPHPHRSRKLVKATHRRPYPGHTHYLLITGRMPLDTRVIQAMSYPIPWYIQTRWDLPPSVIKDVT